MAGIASNGGTDIASILGSNGAELVRSRNGTASLLSKTTFHAARGFEHISIDAKGGQDVARFFLSGHSSVVDASSSQISFSSAGTQLDAKGLNDVRVAGGGKADQIVFSDRGNGDVMNTSSLAHVDYADLTIFARDFEKVLTGDGKAQTASAEISAVDHLFAHEYGLT